MKKTNAILIVGGGIAGLTLATALKQQNLTVEIVERTPKWQPAGAGIMLHANAVAVLSALGLGDMLAKRGQRMPEMQVMDGNGRFLTTLNFRTLEPQFGSSYSLHRADLHDILLSACQDVPIHLGESITSLTETSNSVQVEFTSGRMGQYDLVVGADGLHSRVRELAFAQAQPKLAYSGYTCWRFVGKNRENLPAPIEMWGRGARVGIVPLSNGRCYVYLTQNAPANQTDPPDNWQAHVAAQFADFGGPARPILAQLTADTKLIRHDLVELENSVWGNGRVALVGDAAHAMTPNMGQGAAQAIEGALALAIALRQESHIPAALAHYQKIHRPRVTTIHKRSRLIGQMAQWSNSLACGIRNFAARNTPAAAGQANLQKMLSPGITLAQAY